MIIEDTKENRKIQAVLATMAIENMYADKEFINELLKVDRREKTTEDIRRELLKNVQ